MKKAIILSMFTVLFFHAFADEAKFKAAMQKNITSLYAAQTAADLQDVVNNFDRIGSAEKTRWEPYYYSSFGYIQLALREPDADKKDGYLDLARISVDKASALKKDDSEIVALDGFVMMMKMSVNPAERGQLMSGAVLQTFAKALAINPENPRAIALNAQMENGMAKFFGTTSATACEGAKKALEMLAKENPTDVLAPRWGKMMAEDLLKQCK